MQEKQFFGHPRGLATFFFTEFWERFSFYGLRGLLLLYLMTPKDLGGMGMLQEEGASLLGDYLFLIYAIYLSNLFINKIVDIKLI